MPFDTALRLEMLGATLDALDDCIAVLDVRSHVVYWNDAAAEFTGHLRMNLLSRPCPSDLYKIADDHRCVDDGCECGTPGSGGPVTTHGYTGPKYSGQIYKQKSISLEAPANSAEAEIKRGVLVTVKHHLGHTIPAMLRNLPLRDAMGHKLGNVLLFRAVEELDAIPHGESIEGLGLARSQAEIEDRLEAAFHEWKTNHVPFGLLWITIDQAAQMRRTHGRDACEAMLRIVEHRLAQGLRPAEVIGRWGSDEFLVVSHERNAEMLKRHGEHLAGLTRTADFRWWGDRVSLTASIGVAQAVSGLSGPQSGPQSAGQAGSDTLSRLMLEAKQAMHNSVYAGGNHVSQGRGHAAAPSNPAAVA